MWHEARKQEKKLRCMIVDYRRRAERRREFYEKIKADPTQFMQIHGRPCKIHLEPQIAAAAEKSMMPWQGNADNLIDRFDVRANLDQIPDYHATTPYESVDADLSQNDISNVNYERYRILVQNDLTGTSEDKFLHQIHVEELFGSASHTQQSHHKSDKHSKTPKAAIGYNYDDSTPSASSMSHMLSKSEADSQADEDADEDDFDLDLPLEASEFTPVQRTELNKHGMKYGMGPIDFTKYLDEDLAEKESMRLAKLEEEEKQALSGRKARRERRAYKDRLIFRRGPASPPSYAAAPEPEEDNKSSSHSESGSDSPEKITFITSFGGNDSDEEHASKNTAFVGPKLPSNFDKQKEKTRSRSRSMGRSKVTRRSRSRSYKRRRRSSSRTRRRRSRSHSRRRKTHRSRSRSLNRRRRRRSSRSRSRSRKLKRRHHSSSNSSSSKERRRRRNRYSRSSSSSSHSSSSSGGTHKHRRRRRPSRNRRHKKNGKSRRSRSASRLPSHSPLGKKSRPKSPSDSSSSNSRKISPSPEKKRCSSSPVPERHIIPSTNGSTKPSPAEKVNDPLPTPAVIKPPSPPLKRYYGRRMSRSSSSISLDSDDESNDSGSRSSSRGDKSREQEESKGKPMSVSSKIAGSSSKVNNGASKLNPRERLRKRMQAALNKQLKADKEIEKSRTERQYQEKLIREESLREMSLKLRRRERERRHRYTGQQSSSDSSDNSHSPSSRRSRSKSRSPCRNY